MACAAEIDNGAATDELAASGCAVKVARLFTRVFFSAVTADVAGSSAKGVFSATGAGCWLDVLAKISRLGSGFGFFGLGVGVASTVSRGSGSFAEVAS
jgi:hypothetical protein